MLSEGPPQDLLRDSNSNSQVTSRAPGAGLSSRDQDQASSSPEGSGVQSSTPGCPSLGCCWGSEAASQVSRGSQAGVTGGLVLAESQEQEALQGDMMAEAKLGPQEAGMA